MQRKTRIAIALVAVTAAVAGIVWWQRPVRVETAQAVRGPAIEAVYATGIVEPTVMLPVAPRSGGRLAAISAHEGERVRSGQVLARIESADLDQTVREMQAREQLAQTQFERTRDLVARNFVSPAELDRARMEHQSAQAALKRAQAQRDYNRLVAPADGTVLRRDGEIGQFIGAGQAVFTLACCAPLRVSAEVDEEDIARVAVGQKVIMRTDALPERLFDGEVAEITPKGDPVSRSYRVRIRFVGAPAQDTGGTAAPAGDGPLRTGMTMDTNIVVSRREDALLIPNRAIKGTTVWLVQQGRLQRRTVRTGVTGTERTEIASGLQPGDTVVLSPPERLREGQRAQPVPAAAAASAPR